MMKIFKWSTFSVFALFSVFIVISIFALNYNQCDEISEDYTRQSKSELIDKSLKTIDANGLRFIYRELGTGPLVLLIHGYPGFGNTYKKILPQLAEAGYHVVEYAQRGYFPSDIPVTGDYSMFALGKDVLGLIAAFGEEQAYIVGHDFGATAAYGAAILEPQKIVRMVTIAVPYPTTTSEPSAEAFDRASHFFWFQFGFMSEWISSLGNFAYLEKLIKDIQGTWSMPSIQINDMKNNMSKPGRLRAAICYYRSLRIYPEQIDFMKKNKIKVATLTINSSDSAMFGVKAYQESAMGYSKYFKLRTMNSVGHFIPEEAPNEILKEILTFFNSSIPESK